MIIIFADWSVFLSGSWDHAAFITNYFPIPVFLMYVDAVRVLSSFPLPTRPQPLLRLQVLEENRAYSPYVASVPLHSVHSTDRVFVGDCSEGDGLPHRRHPGSMNSRINFHHAPLLCCDSYDMLSVLSLLEY